MTKFKGVFLDVKPLDQDDLDLKDLANAFSTLELYQSTSADQVIDRLKGVEVAIVNKVLLTGDVLAACPDLKLVLIAATGFNNVDLDAAKRLGITVCNCPAYSTAAVAQHTLMLLLALATSLPDYQTAVRTGGWQKAEHFCFLDFPIVELSGKTLGILGQGELGGAMTKLAEALGMRVLTANLPGRPERADRLSLDELLGQVDALSLHCPLTEQTRNLIGERELSLMKPGAFLINTARGGLVEEQALADALKRGHLGGAATDVLTKEPPVDGNPLLENDVPRLIVTPHSAWGSREARQRAVDQLVANAQAFRIGQPICRVA
jgi:glycerate dehydrogenase